MRKISLIALASSVLAVAATAATSNLGTSWVSVEGSLSRNKVSGISLDSKDAGVAVNLPVGASMDAQVFASYGRVDKSDLRKYFGDSSIDQRALGVGLRFFNEEPAGYKPFLGLGLGWVKERARLGLGAPTQSVSSFVGIVETGVEINSSIGVTTPSVALAFLEKGEAWSGTLALEHMVPVTEIIGVGATATYTFLEHSEKAYGIGLFVRLFF